MLGGTLGEGVIVKEQVQLLEQLEDRYTQTKDDNSKLHKESTELKQRTAALQTVMQQMGHHYAQDRLAGKKVAILHLEPVDLSPLMTVLQRAGADVTSTLSITNNNGLFDPTVVPELNTKLALESDADFRFRQQRLADALVRELFHPTDQAVLKHLQENKVLTANGAFGTKPDAVLLIGGASEQSAERMNKFDAPLLRALRNQGIIVVGSEASDVQRSAIRYYRDLGFSTVDNIDQMTGMVALVDILSGAKGHYGIKKSAEALLPKSTTAKEVTAQ